MIQYDSLYRHNILHWLEEFIRLWNIVMPEAFPLQKALFVRNILQSSNLDLHRSSMAFLEGRLVGLCIVKSAPSENRQNSQQAEQLWISLILVDKRLQRNRIGSTLLKGIHQKPVPVSDIHCGMDPGHLFPGVPDQLHAAIAFFEQAGFQHTGQAFDLTGNLQNWERKTAPEAFPYLVRRLRPDEQGDLLNLIRQEFSSRWYEDTKEQLLHERTPHSVIGLFDGDQLAGFTHVHVPTDNFYLPSVYWQSTGTLTEGGLGPVGIASQLRGKGLGTWFMEEALAIMKKEGTTTMCIDWTILVEFYRKFGFTPVQTYHHYKLDQLP
ncbi:GNAT family N-acetyltransferase [Salisediminibacterium beveridgei]|uniref:Acetyltransferase n=1 Tax=Salisediminibacterium beveridgei TaxID=632773 RepID=A0A1D7QRZ1_9BACI|nr:GNAT family N-acetyltransferase [Salisediminibacterium beveridgei]AOM81758.1 Acetyltransferase [Salisediminibacterium beveridgei]